MSNIIGQFFDDTKLNEIANEIIELDAKINLSLEQAYQNMTSAFERRWVMGKLLYDNQEYIITKCDTWTKFADSFGQPIAVLSNNKRGYENLLNAGCDTFDKVVKLLTEKQITPTVRNFEKIGTLLNEPLENRKLQRPRDEERLIKLNSEIEEIIQRNESANHNVVEKALELKERSTQAISHITKTDARKLQWQSRKYMDWVKKLGYDAFTGLPCPAPDPHHTDINGGSGGFGSKLPDCFTVPVSRETHEMLESGFWEPDKLEIADALINTMALFIITHYGDK
jgi:hypothetical protein